MTLSSSSRDPGVAAEPRTRRRRLLQHLKTPLYREGYALVLNQGLTSVLGVAFWLVAARTYSAPLIGVNSAAISAMMFLAGIAQLNLSSLLIRFLPVAGYRSRRFVVSAYITAIGCAAVAGSVFIVGLGWWSPELVFLNSSGGFIALFVVGTMAWCIFNLQDGVLTGLRAASIVPLENALYALAKLALVLVLAGAAPMFGVFISWTTGLVASLIMANAVIFIRLLPRHMTKTANAPGLPPRRALAGFLSADYLSSLFWLVSMTLMPVLVLGMTGPRESGYFALAYMVALPLFAVAAGTGPSLVASSSRRPQKLAVYARKVLVQTACISVPAASLLALGAPVVLRFFGDQYAEQSASLLSLLALASIPHVVTNLYLSIYRVRRHMRRVVLGRGVLSGLAVGLTIVLVPPMGIVGVGVAWLAAEVVVASLLVASEPRALWPSREERQSSRSGSG